MKNRFKKLFITALIGGILSFSCGTMLNVRNSSGGGGGWFFEKVDYIGYPYGGTVYDIVAIGSSAYKGNFRNMMGWMLLDLPLSIIGDTLTLPFVLRNNIKNLFKAKKVRKKKNIIEMVKLSKK